MTTILSAEIDNEIRVLKHSITKYSKRTPLTGSTLSGSLTSTTEFQFQLLNQCSNFSKSYLQFTSSVMDPGATVHYAWIFAGLSAVQYLRLVGSNQTAIVDWREGGYFSRTVSLMKTKWESLANKSALNDNEMETSAAGAELAPVSSVDRSASATNRWPDGTASTSNFYEPVHMYFSPDTTATWITYRFQMSEFKETFFEIDTVVSPLDQWTLIVGIPATTKLGYITTSTDATTGASGYTTACDLTNIGFYQAIELNKQVIAESDRMSMQGRDLVVPFIHTFVRAHSTTTSIPLYQSINASFGQRLLRIYVSIFHGTASVNTYLQNDDALITSYHSLLNSQRLNIDGEVTVADSLNLLVNKRNLEGSCFTNDLAYGQNFVHCENFCGLSPSMQDPSVVDGIPIVSGADLNYAINYVVPSAAYNSYLAVVTQRNLRIQNGNVSII